MCGFGPFGTWNYYWHRKWIVLVTSIIMHFLTFLRSGLCGKILLKSINFGNYWTPFGSNEDFEPRILYFHADKVYKYQLHATIKKTACKQTISFYFLVWNLFRNTDFVLHILRKQKSNKINENQPIMPVLSHTNISPKLVRSRHVCLL